SAAARRARHPSHRRRAGAGRASARGEAARGRRLARGQPARSPCRERRRSGEALGLRLYKLACVWPVEPEGLKAFAAGLEQIVVVEEKRALIETQLREI